VTPADILPTLLAVAGCDRPPEETAAAGRNLVDIGNAGTRRMLVSEDRRYLYLANRRRMNTNAKGKHMTRRDKTLNRVLRASIADHHVLRAFIDPPYKLIITAVRARNATLSWLGTPIVTRLHNGDPYITRHEADTLALELFDLDADPGERRNLLLDRPELVDALQPLLEASRLTPLRLMHLRELVA
jgi:arylsulfatase A-like enzyme